MEFPWLFLFEKKKKSKKEAKKKRKKEKKSENFSKKVIGFGGNVRYCDFRLYLFSFWDLIC